MIKVKLNRLLQTMLDSRGESLGPLVSEVVKEINTTQEPHGNIRGKAYYSWRSPDTLFLSFTKPTPGDYLSTDLIERLLINQDPPIIAPTEYPWGYYKKKMTRLEYIDYLQTQLGLSAEQIVSGISDLSDEAEFWGLVHVKPLDYQREIKEMMTSGDSVIYLNTQINDKFRFSINELESLHEWVATGNCLKWKWGSKSVHEVFEDVHKKLDEIEKNYYESLESRVRNKSIFLS